MMYVRITAKNPAISRSRCARRTCTHTSARFACRRNHTKRAIARTETMMVRTRTRVTQYIRPSAGDDRNCCVRLRATNRPCKMPASPMPLAAPLIETRLNGLAPHRQGKVRDIYDVGDALLLVATDRISAFDYVLGSGIPDKGKVLTQLSAFWFDYTRDIVANHVLETDASRFPADLRRQAATLAGRSMLVRKTNPVPIECVARGYLSGSGWKDYVATGAVCGVPLPKGLRESDKLPEPIFTPATKATSGHDINISERDAAGI